MIGNHLLEYRMMKDHQEQLLAEGQQRQQVHAVRNGRTRASRGEPRRGSVARFLRPAANAERLWTAHASGRRRRRIPTLVELERSLVKRLSDDACRRARRLARERAIARFARTHSLWYESLFDRRFFRALPDDFFRRSPSSVARSWASQFPYYRGVSRERDVERLEPVAREFLQILAEEENRLAVAPSC